MRIERAVLREVPLTLAHPFRSSAGVVAERRVLLLTLSGDGLEGWSECVAPGRPTYTYETVDTAWLVLTEVMLPRVIGCDVTEPESVLAAAGELRGHPMAKASVEMAAWDLAARAKGVSLSRMLGGTRDRVEVGVSLGIMPTTESLGDTIEDHLRDGYARVKLKIAPKRDAEVLTAVRERFPDLRIWADANSAYSREDAAHLGELDRMGLEMLEEPLAPGDLVGYARLQERLATPICLDESVANEHEAATALELGSLGVLNLKPGRVGGLAASRRILDRMTGAGLPVWCGGMLETGIGRAHNLALASLEGFTLPGDISASRRYWERDIVAPEHEVVNGTMAVPAGPGIGVAIDTERIEGLSVRSFEPG